MSVATVSLNLRMPIELSDKLVKAAKGRNMTKTAYVLAVLAKAERQHLPEVAIGSMDLDV